VDAVASITMHRASSMFVELLKLAASRCQEDGFEMLAEGLRRELPRRAAAADGAGLDRGVTENGDMGASPLALSGGDVAACLESTGEVTA
jgi:hypothetical protein